MGAAVDRRPRARAAHRPGPSAAYASAGRYRARAHDSEGRSGERCVQTSPGHGQLRAWARSVVSPGEARQKIREWDARGVPLSSGSNQRDLLAVVVHHDTDARGGERLHPIDEAVRVLTQAKRRIDTSYLLASLPATSSFFSTPGVPVAVQVSSLVNCFRRSSDFMPLPSS